MCATRPWKPYALLRISMKPLISNRRRFRLIQKTTKHVQKLKLTPDEAQFASQFNGGFHWVHTNCEESATRSENIQQMLFRFVAFEIVECWPASTAAKPEQQGIFQRRGEWGEATASPADASGPSLMKRNVLVVDVGGIRKNCCGRLVLSVNFLPARDSNRNN